MDFFEDAPSPTSASKAGASKEKPPAPKAKAAPKKKAEPKKKAAAKPKKKAPAKRNKKNDDDASSNGEETEESESDSDDGEEPESDGGNASDSEDDGQKRDKTAKAKGGATGNRATDALDFTLPPLTNIDSIFCDLVGPFADELVALYKKLGRPIRIATMCSGTEAPVLAMKMMFRQLYLLRGIKIETYHVFSAEIEPFKQAYIERNFGPPILFRDVVELRNDEARTAYGAMVDVPGDVDILVAGTSCVDYSALNNRQKGIDEGGESSRTFHGMLQWVNKHRPPIVILENVVKAPWKAGVKHFESINYAADWIKLDSKKYYIPHTRTRGYLIAFPNKPKQTKSSLFDKKSNRMEDLTALQMTAAWKERVKEAARRASAPTEAFLLDTDDPRIFRARQELAHITLKADGTKKGATAWAKCAERHASARADELLGQKRALTDWQDNGGKPTLPDGAWQDWGEAQTERVLDLVDISFLREAKKGVDVTYKSAIWNLSQNVDRTTSSALYGITPCLTPNMIPYLTNRGGPVVGVEALALQGLPIDELVLTRENTDQLADLAGNAMSSTVVGAAIAAALVVAGHTLVDREYPALDDAKMEDSEVLSEEQLEARFRGSDRLVEHPVDLTSVKPVPQNLLERAHRSARRCTCEGRSGLTTVGIVQCLSCNYSSCETHAGKPEHVYVKDTAEREKPKQFETDLKEYLPMRLTISGFDRESLVKLVAPAEERGAKFSKKTLKRYLDIVSAAVEGAEFHFRHIDRRETWRAIFATDAARLELHFEQSGMEWRLFAIPPPDLTLLDELRRQLEQPVARIKVAADAADLLAGSWELKLPLADSGATVKLTFGEKWVPSWRAILDLAMHVEEKRPSEITVRVEGQSGILDRFLDGTYHLEAKCGTAANSLYRRTSPLETEPLYFFFDPSAYLQDKYDCYVFADNCARTETTRGLIASLQPTWRLPNSAGKAISKPFQSPTLVIPQVWSSLEGSKIVPGAINVDESSQFSTIKTGFELVGSEEDCLQAEDLLIAKIPLAKSPSDVWAKDTWHEVDLLHEGVDVFNKLAWMVSRIPEWQQLKEWQGIKADTLPDHICQRCAPTLPEVDWIRRLTLQGKDTLSWKVSVIARENGLESAGYETLLKDRPSPLLVHTRQKGSTFEFRVGLNAVTLAHRAIAQLPQAVDKMYKRSAPSVEWRLLTDSNIELGAETEIKPVFTIKDNRSDPEADEPERFAASEFRLRPEQRRSLHWMIEQEENPQEWIEEEVAEAILPQLGWHAQAKATRSAKICGGVVADAVGYGKTAITLALIAARLEADAKLPKDKDRIAIKATLIVLPPHLVRQWPKEVAKFTNPALKVLSILTMSSLKKATIKHFMDANIIFMARSVFDSDLFWPHLADFSAAKRDIKHDKKKAPRYFRHTVAAALDGLGAQVQRLRNEGSRAVEKAIAKARKERNEDFTTEDFFPESKKKENAKAEAAAAKAGEDYVPRELPERPTEFGRDDKQNVNDKDWDLKSDKVRGDWMQMKCPPPTIFSYARVIVDEFTYLNPAALVGLHACRGRARWILSGTPPLDDFSDVKSIAALLHVHLGTDDENEGKQAAVKVRAAERTRTEQFRSYCEVRTKAWHARRDEIAQRFLDQFARSNIANTSEIPLSTEYIPVRLPGAEMAIYRELEHHLYAVDPNLSKFAKSLGKGKGKKAKLGDREERLKEALGNSATPEEALLKRCSHFSLDLPETRQDGKAPDICKYIGDIREEQLTQASDEIKGKIAALAEMNRLASKAGYYSMRKDTDKKAFEGWVAELYSPAGFGDVDATQCLRGLAALAGCVAGKVLNSSSAQHTAEGKKAITAFKAKRPAGVEELDYVGKRITTIRTQTAALRVLCKELIGRVRSKRYFEAVRDVLDDTSDASDASNNHAILSCCGHSGQLDVIQEATTRGACFESSCNAFVQPHNIIRGVALGTARESGHFGYKLETLVTLIKETPADDRVIVFTQFEDLFTKVYEALTVYGIKTTIIAGGVKKQAAALDHFQDEDATDVKVLLLLATDSSSSGANLGIANHAFFVSPLLTETRSNFKALTIQAIGRIHRYGQMKTANVVHLLVHDTLDMKVFGEREFGFESHQAVEKMAAVLEEQPGLLGEKRPEVVNPARKKKVAGVARWKEIIVASKPKTKTAKGKKAEKEAKEEEEDAEDEGEEAESSPAKPIKAVKAAPVKGRKKPAVEKLDVDSDDGSIEFIEKDDSGSEAASDAAESEAEETDDDAESIPSGDDDDEYGGVVIRSSPVPQRAKMPRRSAAAGVPKSQLADEDEDDNDDEMEDAEPVRKAKPTKKRRIIADSSDEDDEEAQPVASTSRAVMSSSKKASPKTAAKTSEPAAKRRKSVAPAVFDGVVIEVKKSRKKKQSTLASFFSKPTSTPAAATSTSGSPSGSLSKAVSVSTRQSKEPSPLIDDTESTVAASGINTPATEADRQLGGKEAEEAMMVDDDEALEVVAEE